MVATPSRRSTTSMTGGKLRQTYCRPYPPERPPNDRTSNQSDAFASRRSMTSYHRDGNEIRFPTQPRLHAVQNDQNINWTKNMFAFQLHSLTTMLPKMTQKMTQWSCHRWNGGLNGRSMSSKVAPYSKTADPQSPLLTPRFIERSIYIFGLC